MFIARWCTQLRSSQGKGCDEHGKMVILLRPGMQRMRSTGKDDK